MPHDFDPYYQWLGIPPSSQPPNHYRLLAIELFEDSPDVIENAADRLMAHIRTFQAGQHAQLSQKLLNEIAAAKVSLLDADRKAQYDAVLRTGLSGAGDTSSQGPHSPGASTHPGSPNAAFAADSVRDVGLPVRPPRTVGPFGTRTLIAAVTALAAVMLVAAILMVFLPRDTTPVGGGENALPVPAAGQAESIDEAPAEDAGESPPAAGEAQQNEQLASEQPVEEPPDRTAVPSEKDAKDGPSTQTPDPEGSADGSPERKSPEPRETDERPPPPSSTTRERPSEPPVAGPGQTYALRFRGNSRVRLAGTIGIAHPSKNFTAETWVRFEPNYATRTKHLMGDGAAGGIHPDVAAGQMAGWCLIHVGQLPSQPSLKDVLFFHGIDIDGKLSARGGKTGELGESWHHIAVCSEANEDDAWRLTEFVDGKLTARHVGRVAQVSRSPTDFYVGCPEFVSPNAQFHGDIAAFRVSSVCRYRKPFTPPAVFAKDAATVVLLDFSTAHVGKIADLSGKDRHGQIVGAEWIVIADPPSPSPPARPGLLAPAKQDPPKTALPAADVQEQRKRLIKGIYREKFAKAKSSTTMVQLSAELRKQAGEDDDAATQYALLSEARDLGVAAGDAFAALEAVNEIQRRFAVDVWSEKFTVLKKLAMSAKRDADRRSIAEAALDAADEALRAEQYDVADKLLDISSGVARGVKDAALSKLARKRLKEVAEGQKLWVLAEQARESLAETPGDPASNLRLGKYLCFLRGDWSEGAAYLARGDDESLADLARKDLLDPFGALQQLGLAEGWYEWGKKAIGTDQNGAWRRAQYWCERAYSRLSGLPKSNVNKLLDELVPRVTPVDRGPQSHLPWLVGAVGELRRYDGPAGIVTSLAVSHSGRLLASGHQDGAVRLWELVSGRLRKELRSKGGSVNAVVLSPDERFVFAGGTKAGLSVWDTRTGEAASQINTSAPVQDLAISSDGRLLLWLLNSSGSGKVGLWDLLRAELRRLNCTGRPAAGALSANGRLAAAGDSRGLVHVWNVTTSSVVHRLVGHSAAIHDVAISADGRMLATCGKGEVILWDADAGRQLGRLSNVGYPRCLAFSCDNRRLLTAGLGGEIRLFDIKDQQQVLQLRTQAADGGDGFVYSVAFLPDPRGVVTGSADGAIHLWRLPD